jgi:adenylate cyclase
MREPKTSLYATITSAPEQIEPRYKRNFAIVQVAFLVLMGVHSFQILLFWSLGANILALVNIASVLVYPLVIWVNKRGKYQIAAGLVFLEVAIHQSLAVYFLGIGSGFQYHLIAFGSGMIIFPFRHTISKFLYPILSIALFWALDISFREAIPMVPVDLAFLDLLKIFNITVSFITLVGVILLFENTANRAEAKLQEEYQRAENLLHNILPVSIAQRLKEGEELIADKMEDATILFADIKGFTPIASALSPEELVQTLNELFKAFDDLVEDHEVEKIKTIGDSYMVASGIPKPRLDHQIIVAELALKMLEVAETIRFQKDLPVQIRIGIHSGPVVAGVIGKKKFSYDLWGDTVNVASRLESSSAPGQIHVSQSVYQGLEKYFHFEKRQKVHLKGKGETQTYFLYKDVPQIKDGP